MNLLLITADQWRADCLSSAGHPCVRTPALDRLATDGVRFANHFGQASPCGPSRASLYTGMYAFNHRSVTNGSPLDARHTTIALEARKAGLRPVLFGYTDTSHDPRPLAADDPRRLTYEGICPGFDVELALLGDAGPWLEHLNRRRGRDLALADLYEGPLGAAAPFAADDSETAFLTDRFLHWLDRRTRADPWFAHLSFIRPHPPWVAAAPYHDRYHPDEVPAPIRGPSPEAEGRLHPWLAEHLRQPLTAGWFGKPGSHEEAEIRRARAIYYGLISEVDHHVGRIMASLERAGRDHDTLVIVTSDHGEMLGDHWMLGKSGFFPEAFRVPLIIRDPRATSGRGRVVDGFTEHVDLMPTVLECLGCPVPRQCDGHSLVPWLDGANPEGWRTAAHYEFDFRDLEGQLYERVLGLPSDRCALAVEHGERHLYVHFNGLPPLFFDLEADPHQRHDLAADPGRAAAVLAAAQGMLTWRMDHAERRLTGCKLTSAGMLGQV